MARIHHRHRDRLIKERGSKCQLCSKQAPVEAHHIETQKEDGTSDNDNILLLCEPCHSITLNFKVKFNWSKIKELNK